MTSLKEGMVPFIKSDEIEQMITLLADTIDQQYRDEPLVLICPLKGSFMFVADLCRKIKNPNLEVEFVQVKSIGRSVSVVKDIGIEVYNKHVIICEEIIDAGKTLSFLRKHLMLSVPASIRICALIDKPSRREIPLKPEFVGKTIDDRYIIGYGMDSDELGRNYSEIYNFMQ
jgi:hypoxanthine phosphoribosyltransferase